MRPRSGRLRRRRDPDVVGVLGIEVLAHGADLAVAKLEQEVVLLPIEAAVLEVAARLDFERDPIALGDRGEDGHPQAALQLLKHGMKEAVSYTHLTLPT